MKFRCERDVLVEGARHRRSRRDSRGGARCRCCPASASSSTGDQLQPHRQRPRSRRSTVDDDVTGERGRRRRAAGQADRRHRPRPRARRGHGRADDDEVRIASGRSQFSVRTVPADEFPRLSEPAERGGHRSPAEELRRGAAPGGAGGEHRRGPADPHRRADDRRGRRAAAGRHRLLPAGRARPAGHGVLARGPERAGAVAGAATSCSELLGGRARSRLRLGERDATFEVGKRAAHHPPDRGRVPELPRPDPRQATRTASPWARSRCSTRSAGCSCWRRRPHRCASTMSAEGLELAAITQDVGQAARGPRRQVRGRGADRRVQPRVPHRRRRGVDGRRGHARDARRAEAGRHAVDRESRTSSTCSCPSGCREPVRVRRLWLTDFRSLRPR